MLATRGRSLDEGKPASNFQVPTIFTNLLVYEKPSEI